MHPFIGHPLQEREGSRLIDLLCFLAYGQEVNPPFRVFLPSPPQVDVRSIPFPLFCDAFQALVFPPPVALSFLFALPGRRRFFQGGCRARLFSSLLLALHEHPWPFFLPMSRCAVARGSFFLLTSQTGRTAFPSLQFDKLNFQ